MPEGVKGGGRGLPYGPSRDGALPFYDADIPPPSCWSVFVSFLRIGVLTFGGGVAMLTVLWHELGVRRDWIAERDFVDNTALATSVPGPIAVNMAFLEGYHLRGGRGAAAAALGVILPSFVVILLIAALLLRFFDHPRVEGFFRGAGAAVVGLVAYAAVKLGKVILRGWREIIAWVAAGGVVLATGVHPVAAVVISVLLCGALSRLGRRVGQDGGKGVRRAAS